MHPALPDWKTTALATIPDPAPGIDEAETPHRLRSALDRASRDAYGQPRDDAPIGPIPGCAKWCLDQPRQEALAGEPHPGADRCRTIRFRTRPNISR